MKRPAAGQVAVTIGAMVCTSVGLNTAWGFTHSYLGIANDFTRIALCGTGEIVLVSLGLAARDNKRATGAAGAPGMLVWLITAFLSVPAFAEASSEAHGFGASIAAGLWRAILGPVAAAFLWHLAMGLEIRRERPDARSTGILARLARHWGQSALAWCGIADRDASAAELLRIRARVRAANLSDKLGSLSDRRRKGRAGARLRRKLRAALRDAGVAHNATEKTALLADLAVSSHAAELPNLAHPSPWNLDTTEEPAAELPAEPAPVAVPPAAGTGTPAEPLAELPAEHPVSQSEPATAPAAPSEEPAPAPAALAPAALAGTSAEGPRNTHPSNSAGQAQIFALDRNTGGTRADHIRTLVGNGVTDTGTIRQILTANGIALPSDRYIRRLVTESRNTERNTDVPAIGTGQYM